MPLWHGSTSRTITQVDALHDSVPCGSPREDGGICKRHKPVMKETAVFSEPDDVSKVVLLRRGQMVEPYPDTGGSVPLTER